MSTTTPIAASRSGRNANRIWSVAKLNVINRWTVLWTPLMIFAFVLLVNMAIWWIINSVAGSPSDRADALNGTQWSGAALYIFIYLMVIAIQAMNTTFPYALGLSLTRREFSLGTSLAFLLMALGYGALLTALSYIEEWTNGWGLGGHMFTSVYFGSGPIWERLFIFTAGLLFFFFIGAFNGTIFMRWKTNGVLVTAALCTILLVGAVALITASGSWLVVGEWFITAGPVGVAAWLLLPAAIAAVIGYGALSRATPRG